jgi:NTE family protein
VLLKELRMIAMLRQVAQPGDCEGALWAGMRIHRITSDEMSALGASSKLIAEWDFLCKLRDLGRQAAEDFLTANASDLGQRSSYDLDVQLRGI